MSVLGLESGYTVFPSGSGHILPYIPPLVLIQIQYEKKIVTQKRKVNRKEGSDQWWGANLILYGLICSLFPSVSSLLQTWRVIWQCGWILQAREVRSEFPVIECQFKLTFVATFIAAIIIFTVRGLKLSYRDCSYNGENGYFFLPKGALMEPIWQLNFTERGLVTHFLILKCCHLSKY